MTVALFPTEIPERISTRSESAPFVVTKEQARLSSVALCLVLRFL
jgi:hypothetical protein